MGAIALGIGAAAAIGGTAMSANAASKSKNSLRKVAKTPFTDYRALQLDSLGGNIAALPKATELANKVNTANQEERLRMLNAGIPGYEEITGQTSGNLRDMLKGILPDDVLNTIQRTSAARALGGGYGGSGMHNNLTARDFGLSSLDLMGRGMSFAPAYLSNMYGLAVPGQFDVTSMLLNPTNMIDLRSRERSQNMNAAMGAASAPGATSTWGSGLQQMGGGMTAGMGMPSFGSGSSGNMGAQYGSGSEMDLMQRMGGQTRN